MTTTPRSLSSLLAKAARTGVPVILDGAMGTELELRGADTGGPAWSALAPLDRPDLVEAVHRDCVAAGADLVRTCTFRATEAAYAAAGRTGDERRAALRRAAELARRAAGGGILVAGVVGPLADCWRPDLAPAGAAAFADHLELARELVAAGIDALWLETFGALPEIEAAAAAAREAGRERGIPFALSVTTRRDGALLSGDPLPAAVRAARQHGAVAILVNCLPPSHVDAALDALSGIADPPWGVYANLGRAEAGQDWAGSARLEPEEYADLAAGWVARGARIVGACCGSRPAHVAALAGRFKAGRRARLPRNQPSAPKPPSPPPPSLRGKGEIRCAPGPPSSQEGGCGG